MNILVLGGNSDIAHAIARIFARNENADITLASRTMESLEKRVEDLRVRYGTSARGIHFDAVDFNTHRQFYDKLDPKPDIVIVAFGKMHDQMDVQTDFTKAMETIDTNYMGAVSILEIVAADFERRGHGTIVGISSAAGERGRKSNYLYGSAKAGFTTYLSGLRNRLYPRGVHVMTIIPGFVATKMTRNMDLPDRLTATPEQVAVDVYKAFLGKKDVIYSRWFWKWIMMVISLIPEPIFKRMSI